MADSLKRKAAHDELGQLPDKRIKSVDCPATGSCSTSAARTPKSRTFRISRIPRSVSYESLKVWLEQLAITTDNITQLSLAPNSLEFKQATVTFKVPPLVLKHTGSGTYTFEGPEKAIITIDSHFQGMTVLHDAMEAGTAPVAAE